MRAGDLASMVCFCCGVAAASNDTMIIKYKDLGLGFGVNDTDTTTTFPPPPSGVELVANAPFLGYQVFRLLDSTMSVGDYCTDLEMNDPEVEFCEPDSEVSVIEQAPANAAMPNDPLLKNQYNLPIIKATNLWQQGLYGSKDVLVCFPDTGTSLDHPDLQGSIRNGTSFLNGAQSSAYADGNGHGAFTTGVVGALTNNGIGIAGVVQNPSILACQFMDASGNGALTDAALCFNWCLQEQANVISCSFGTTAFSAALQSAVQAVSAQNIVFVASAGNEGTDNDATPHYPSQFSTTLPGVITVGASDQKGNLWTRSNYGKSSVQIVAPGVGILGLGLGGAYVTLSGTSMAGELRTASQMFLMKRTSH